jgi:hypothetical protein
MMNTVVHDGMMGMQHTSALSIDAFLGTSNLQIPHQGLQWLSLGHRFPPYTCLLCSRSERSR